MNQSAKKIIKQSLYFILNRLTPSPMHPSMRGPGLYLGWRLGWLKGLMMRPIWNVNALLGGTQLSVGKRFSLQGTLKMSGPGRVVFGDDVIVGGVTTPFTHGESAQIIIGNETFLNGARFGASELIQVGERCILADVRIMDTDFHAVHKERNHPRAVAAQAPVRIGNNVWIAAGSAVLKGVTIGDDSVIAFGSVVISDIHSGVIAGGNPAKQLKELPEPPRY